MDLSIVIVNFNSGRFLKKAIGSIKQYTRNLNYEIIVVDNGSYDDSLNLVENIYTDIILIKNKCNVGFAKANNMALKRARGAAIVLFNPDAWLENNSFEYMYSYLMKNSDVGLVGCRFKFPDGRVQTSAYSYTSLGKKIFHAIVGPFRGKLSIIFKKYHFAIERIFPGKIIRTYSLNYLSNGEAREVDCITGACMMFRREILNSVGYLDESFFMYCEDQDFCRRHKNSGLKVMYLPSTYIIHYSGWKKNEINPFIYKKRFESLRYYCSKYYKQRFIYYNLFRLLNYLEFKIVSTINKAKNTRGHYQ